MFERLFWRKKPDPNALSKKGQTLRNKLYGIYQESVKNSVNSGKRDLFLRFLSSLDLIPHRVWNALAGDLEYPPTASAISAICGWLETGKTIDEYFDLVD